MNAEEFYEEMKAGLKFLGLAWGEMNLCKVWVDSGTFHMKYGNKTVAIEVSKP